jgi:hypothetical protein
MLMEALVVDNSTFYKNGKIRVRVPHFYHRKMIWNLADEYPDFKEEAQIEGETEHTNDFEAYVYSPYGGGRNFGLFFLPQVNQRGVVMPIGQGQKKLLWLGSFFIPEYDDNFEITHVNIPSDKPENEGEDTDGVIDGEQNMDAEDAEEAFSKNFVARFKTTKDDSQDNVDWQKRPTSNIITIGDKEANLRHYSFEDGWDENTPQKWQDLIIHKNEDEEDEIKSTVQNDADKKSTTITQKENIVEIQVDNDGDISKFYIANDDNEVSFYFEDSYGNIISLDKENGVKVETEKDITATTEGDITAEAGGDVVLDLDGALKLNGASDQAVLYSQLKKIITAFESHIHQTPTGPSTSPLTASQAPITSKTASAKNNMKSGSLELE